MKKRRKKLQQALKSRKEKAFKMRKSGKFWLAGATLLLTFCGAAMQVTKINAEVALPSASAGNIVADHSSMVSFEWPGVNGPLYTSVLFVDATLNGQAAGRVFCLDRSTEILNAAAAIPSENGSTTNKYYWNILSATQQRSIQTIAYLAMNNAKISAKTDVNMYFAAQFMIWNIEEGIKLDRVPTITADVTTGATNPSKIADDIGYLSSLLTTFDKLPSFNNETQTLVLGSMVNYLDSNAVLGNFPAVDTTNDLMVTRSGNTLTVGTSKTTNLGQGQILLDNDGTKNPNIWLTQNPNGSVGQNVMIQAKVPLLKAQVKVNIIGLGETTLIKEDEATNSSQTQGQGRLAGSEWTLYNSDNSPVKWTEGQTGYPITLLKGEKVDEAQIVLKMGGDTQISLKNLDFSKKYYWKETKAPFGYALSSKHYEVEFNQKQDYDTKGKNFKAATIAQDKVLDFSFAFTKAMENNGSLIGENGAEFEALSKTTGRHYSFTSGDALDANGFNVQGSVQEKLVLDDYHVHQTFIPERTQAINDFDIELEEEATDNGAPAQYTVSFIDSQTKRLMAKRTVDASNLVDDANSLFKINLGIMTDKEESGQVLAVKTQAHTENGDKIIDNDENKAYDQVDLEGVIVGEKLLAKLHRIDGDHDTVVSTLAYDIDDKAVKNKGMVVEASLDKSGDTPVTYYVWEEDIIGSEGQELSHNYERDDKEETLYYPNQPAKKDKTSQTKLGVKNDKTSEPSQSSKVHQALPFTGDKKNFGLLVLGLLLVIPALIVYTYLVKFIKK